MDRGLRLVIGCGMLLAAVNAFAGSGGGALAQEAGKGMAGFRLHKPLTGPGTSSKVVSGSVLGTGAGTVRVAVQVPKGWEVWSVSAEGEILDIGHLGWSGDGKTVRIEWERAEAEEVQVAGHGELPWDGSGERHDAFRLSDWLVAKQEPVALPFLGGEHVGFRFAGGDVLKARAVSGEEVDGTWWWSRGLLHVRLDGFSEVATYEWRPLARHVGWNTEMSAPVAAAAVARAPSRPEGALPPPRSLPGAAAVCNRDVLGALLKTAAEASDVVSAIGIEKETILLCRDRQQLVVEIVQAETRLAELIAEGSKPKTAAPAPAAAVKTVAQLVSAKPPPAPRAEEKPAGDVAAVRTEPAKAAPRGARAKSAKATWSWFSMIGRAGRLVAGVTDGSGAWFVAEGESVPGAGPVKRISARPPVVEVAGVGMLAWVEGPPGPGEKMKASGENPPAAESLREPIAEDLRERVVERVFGGGGDTRPGGASLKGRADAVDGDTLRMGEVRIRLWGVDAPEKDQSCRAEGLDWGCGLLATAALRSRATDIECREKGRDGYGRVLAVCFDGGEDVNAWLVAEGWALAYRRFSRDYVEEEEAARAARKGMHRGEFVQPWDWRRGERLGRGEERRSRGGDAAPGPRETGSGRLPPLPQGGAGR